jgi:hypothetical protein
VDKLHEILRGGEMSKEKGVIKHQSEKLVNKAKEKLTPDEPVREAVKPETVKLETVKLETVKKETVRLGVDNHLVDSLIFPAYGEDYLIESVARGGSDVPKDKEAEIRRAAKQRGYALAEVE